MEYLPEALSDGSYINETERNVHVWCSIARPCSYPKFFEEPTLGLIAGCYIHKEGLPVYVFYNWLDRIIDLKRNNTGQHFLFRCPVDPRTISFRAGFIPFPGGPPLERTLATSVKEGHYLIYEYDKQSDKYLPSWPSLISTGFKRRSRSPSQTCTPSPGGTPSQRDTRTRIAVRMRDKRCLVTGQTAVKRARGGNFTGLEVAHIYPLMAVGDQSWTQLLPASALARVLTRQTADRPHNAILLRADIHSLFDDYQWSIWSEQGTHRIVRFEKSGAMVLEHYPIADLRPSSLTTTESCSMELLQAHLHVALLIHVRGFGKRAVAGFNATLL